MPNPSAMDHVKQIASFCEQILKSANDLAIRVPAAPDDDQLRERVDAMVAVRLRRREILSLDRLGDPVWEILLTLLSDELNNRATTINEVTRTSGVPPTTALRHLAYLLDVGALVRDGHSSDKRKVMVTLSHDMSRRLRTFVGGLNEGVDEGL
jgi:DNA-binding MarR family transcriptional regulator